jgi:hypothetical protein
MKDFKYGVFLKQNLPPKELQFFENSCFKILLPQEKSLLYFRCDEIDVSHHSYIEMKIHHPSGESLWPLMVPHNYVFLIDSSDQKKTIGFYGN